MRCSIVSEVKHECKALVSASARAACIDAITKKVRLQDQTHLIALVSVWNARQANVTDARSKLSCAVGPCVGR